MKAEVTSKEESTQKEYPLTSAQRPSRCKGTNEGVVRAPAGVMDQPVQSQDLRSSHTW
jgi:hypothetical protein